MLILERARVRERQRQIERQRERERDDDDDDCFYIALFSALEQTHCARM